jgi:hypothetical protein
VPSVSTAARTSSSPACRQGASPGRCANPSGALALQYWWGVSMSVVHKWRKALGVDRKNNEGTRRLQRMSSTAGADAVRGKSLPPEQIEGRCQRAFDLNLAQYICPSICPQWFAALDRRRAVPARRHRRQRRGRAADRMKRERRAGQEVGAEETHKLRAADGRRRR